MGLLFTDYSMRHGRGAIAGAKKYKQTPFEAIRALFGDTDSLDVLIE